jgi:hypothetical protein
MRKRGLILATAAASLFPVLPVAVHAQDGFMLGQPKAQVTLRAGPMLHRAGGDLLSEFQSQLTLDRGDFRAPALALEISAVMHPRIDVTIGGGWSSVQSGSASFDSSCVGTEYECTFVDSETELPIEQTTEFRVIPLTASVRFYPMSRGRSISELAWIPARTTPYLGGGGGMAWYRLRQYGEFVSQDDFSVFADDWETSGRAGVLHLLAGVDHWFSPRVGLNAEGRYTFGSAKPADDFIGWNTVDLSGLQVGVGLALRW